MMPNSQLEFQTFSLNSPGKLETSLDKCVVQFPPAKRLMIPSSVRKAHFSKAALSFSQVDLKNLYVPIGIVLRATNKKRFISPYRKRLRSTQIVGPVYTRRLKSGSSNSEIIRRWREQLFRMIERETGVVTNSTVATAKLDATVREVVEAMKEVRIKNAYQNSAATALAPLEGFEEAISDENYRAFLRDAGDLGATYGKCVVAYSNGERIALGKDRSEVLSVIGSQKPQGEILIQEIPERVIKFRRPFRVRK